MSEPQRHVYFMGNGVTIVTLGEEQLPGLQVPWVELFGKFLEAMNEDPTDFVLHLPVGEARLFRTTEGRWNWQIYTERARPGPAVFYNGQIEDL